MIFTGFDSILDVLTSQYIYAIIISLLAIIAAFFSVRAGERTEQKNSKAFGSTGSDQEGDDNDKEMDEDDDMKKTLKKSPAVIAEEVIKATMTEEQKKLEQEVKRQQLKEIFKLMQKEREKFGDISVEQVEEQMKLYQ